MQIMSKLKGQKKIIQENLKTPCYSKLMRNFTSLEVFVISILTYYFSRHTHKIRIYFQCKCNIEKC